MFIKRGDGQILSVVKTDSEKESKKNNISNEREEIENNNINSENKKNK